MEDRLKYRIGEILAGYPLPIRREKKQELQTKLGHSDVMMRRYLNATYADTLDFDGTELPIIAHVLGCKMDDLFTKVVLLDLFSHGIVS